MDESDVVATLEISNVMSRYELYYDKKELDPLLELFTSDCSIWYDHFGRSEGIDEMRSFVDDYFSGETKVEESFHVLANPWIDVNGETAVGRWHFLGAYIMDNIGATWYLGFYENEFEKVDGNWKISSIDLESKWTSSYDEGWENDPSVLEEIENE